MRFHGHRREFPAIGHKLPVVRMSDFNKLWAGQTVSLLGSALTVFALPTLAVLVLHATPLQVGFLTALQTLPFPILGMFVGVLADRLSRRRIMIVADVARFAVLATVPLTAAFGVLHLPQVYAVALVSGIGSAFFGITYQSYLPVVVSVDRLTDANMKLEFSNSGSNMVGNALAGALVQLVGAPAAIAFDALSYLASVATLLAIRTEEPVYDGPPLSLRQGVREMVEGLRIVLQSSDLRWIMGATATINFGGAMMGAVVLIFAYRILHLQPGLLGLVYGLAEVGFVGAMFSTRVRARFGLRTTLIASLLASAAGLGGMLFALLGLPYVVLLLSSAVVAVSVPIYNVNQISYRQALVDVRMQGRMNATMRTFVWGTLPVGALAGG
ncbi:MAG: MFS transporter [Candidatus Eremiobacteraeota bacterium]|nr:MFS transporter [Candidatus Eremiobacteraeota bacterium]MBC5802355.1 MFS transporter [Candidatus Eremiobacteraeota bacterium]MBC5822737.1 MFS transporter [Candidatus Eremiobacteraeota bacterium]